MIADFEGKTRLNLTDFDRPLRMKALLLFFNKCGHSPVINATSIALTRHLLTGVRVAD